MRMTWHDMDVAWQVRHVCAITWCDVAWMTNACLAWMAVTWHGIEVESGHGMSWHGCGMGHEHRLLALGISWSWHSMVVGIAWVCVCVRGSVTTLLSLIPTHGF